MTLSITKICCTCKRELEITKFSFRNKEKSTYSKECKECHRKIRKIYYEKNKKLEQERVKKVRKRYRNWFKEIKSQLKCNRCSETHIATLQFHHVNPDEKELAVSGLIARGWSKEKVLKEIEKCEVLCANCHFKEHYKE